MYKFCMFIITTCLTSFSQFGWYHAKERKEKIKRLSEIYHLHTHMLLLDGLIGQLLMK